MNDNSKDTQETIENPSQEISVLVELTGFQRDLLCIITKLDKQPLNGKEIKREISKYYTNEINNGRLYQNLRDLTNENYITTEPIDGRTKSYKISDDGKRILKNYQKWINTCLNCCGSDQG